jgi:cytochrome c-type biogenesis protein CcmE
MRLRKKQRLMVLALALLLVGGATGLVLAALQDKVAFFVTPTQVAERQVAPGKRFRFALSDTAHAVPVVYKGLLPDLFREQQGIVAQGILRSDGTFEAAEVLAKHDENYMPKEVADALKQAGYWQREGEGKPQ